MPVGTHQGNMKDRRSRVVKALVQSGVRLCNLSGVYGMCLASGAEDMTPITSKYVLFGTA